MGCCSLTTVKYAYRYSIVTSFSVDSENVFEIHKLYASSIQQLEPRILSPLKKDDFSCPYLNTD